MATTISSQVDEVQVFDVGEAMKKRDHLSGRVDMARSPNSFIAVFQTIDGAAARPIFTSIRIPIRFFIFSTANSPWKGFREDLLSNPTRAC